MPASGEGWRYRFEKLSEGLVLGTSDETIGMAAAVATDFLVIGDIRILPIRAFTLARGRRRRRSTGGTIYPGAGGYHGPVGSGAGTLATAGAAAPATAGATVAKSGIVALKTARRLGSLPPWLGKPWCGRPERPGSPKV
ncbi:hypothetical protein MBH78_20365 [Oceanimonas sp. NS1]|nr:hypothetical protein [Oceanimonas sp. NS1]